MRVSLHPQTAEMQTARDLSHPPGMRLMTELLVASLPVPVLLQLSHTNKSLLAAWLSSAGSLSAAG